MGDCMAFSATFEEFAEVYKIVDSEEIYTNGTELIPIFRVKQWLEHQKKTGCVIVNVTYDDERLKEIVNDATKNIELQVEDIRANAIKDFAKELIINLDGDIEAYANAGHGLNVYEWLVSYLNSKGAIENEHWKK